MTRGPADSLDTVDSAPVDDSKSPATTVDSAPADDPTPAPALDAATVAEVVEDVAMVMVADVAGLPSILAAVASEVAAAGQGLDASARERLRRSAAEKLARSTIANTNGAALHAVVAEHLARPGVAELLAERGLESLDASARDAFADLVVGELRKPASTLRCLRRDPNLPAVRFVEDLFPETSLFKSLLNAVGIGDLANVVVVNRQFKEVCYEVRMLTGRACMALTGQDCEASAAEARKWYRVCADMHGTREALCMLGAMANEGGASSTLEEMVSSLGKAAIDLDESERCLRAAIAADDSHPGSYVILAPAGHALDAAKVDLAITLADKAWLDREGTDAPYLLAEAGILLDAVLDHDEVPSVHEVPFRYPRREASTLKAQMIQKGDLAGTPTDVLALIEALPPDDRDANCDYLLGKIYMKLDEETPNDEHARRAFHHIHRAFEAGHPRTPFEMGQLAERGRGTDLSLSNAYFMYLRNAFHGGDGNERSIARLAEDVAAGPPYPPELIETMEDFDELRALTGEDDAPLDVEEAFAALGITADLPSESDDDSDSEPDSEDTDERLLRIITS